VNRPIVTATVIAAALAATACAGTARATDSAAVSLASSALRLPGESAVLDAMRDAGVPGVAAAWLRDCRVEHVAHYGVADAASREPVTATTMFEAASLSKPVFAWLMMQLVDSGRLDLDAPVMSSLEYPRIRDRERYSAVTPRLVLSHSTGLPNWAGAPRDWERTDSLVFAFAPGSAFRYSGEGYQLLQVYTEQRTAQPLAERFRGALGEVMPTSVFGGAPSAGAHASAGHDAKGARTRALGDWPRANAAYTLRTTATEYARFVARVCEGTGLSAAARSAMLRTTSRVAGGEWGATPDSIKAELGWALGWGTMTTPGRTIHFHWGDNGPFKAFVALDTAARTGVVYFANGARGLELMELLAAPAVGSVRPISVWLD